MEYMIPVIVRDQVDRKGGEAGLSRVGVVGRADDGGGGGGGAGGGG